MSVNAHMGHVQAVAKLTLEIRCTFSTSVGSVLYLLDDLDNRGDYCSVSIIGE